MRSFGFHPLAFVLAAGLVPARAAAAPIPAYPVFDARVMPATARPPGPRIAGEAFEIRLTPEASARVASSARTAARASALGVAGLDRLAREHGLAFAAEFPAEGDSEFAAFYVAHVPPGGDVLALIESARALPEVASASALPVLRLDAVFPNDSLFAVSDWFYQPANRRDIHAPEAWEISTGDPAIVVGILDAGVIPYHPDLGGTVAGGHGNLWRNAAEANGVAGVDDDANGYVDDVSGWDFVSLASAVDVAPGEDWRDEDNDPNDMVGHGTACAGLVGALTDNARGVSGTAWNVRLLPLRIGWSYLGAPAGDGEVRMDFVARAIRYATRMGVQVLNCSFATANTDGLDAAATAAVAAGVTIVCSSGNWGSPDYLARRPDVISVAATNRDDLVAAFSNTNTDVDLCAPGVEIRSTWRATPVAGDSVALRQPGYSPLLQGTSFSAPLVAGAAALLQSQRVQAGLPLLSPAGVRLRLWEAADDIAALNPTLPGVIGGGRLNVGAALAATGGSTVTRMGGDVVGAPVVIAANSGRDRVAFVTSNAKLVVLDLLSADTLAHVALPDVPVSGVAAVTLDFGRSVALFAGTEQGRMLGYDLDGNPLPGWPTPDLGLALHGGPAIGDLDGDGSPEIVCGGDDAQIHAWRLDGTEAPGFPRALGADPIRVPVALASLDTVPGVDVVAVNEAGLVAVHRGTGQRIPGWPKSVDPAPRAPIVVGNRIAVVSGIHDHRFELNGATVAGFPGVLSGPALADPALLLLDALVIPVGPPFGLELRNFADSAPMGTFPVALVGGPIGTPVIAAESGLHGPAAVLLDGRGLVAFDLATGVRIPGLPLPGGAGELPTIWDLGAGSTPVVVAGSGPDSSFYIYGGATGLGAPTGLESWNTPRGGFRRTGTPGSGSPLREPFVDDVRPAAVSDLVVLASDDTSVTLQWTATGSDSLANGRVGRWLVRGTTGAMTESAFGTAPVQRLFSAVASPGSPETFVVSPLAPGTQHAWALKAEDRAGNLSALSNVVTTGTSPGLSFAIRNHPSQLPVTFEWQGAGGAASRLRVFDLAGRERASVALGAGAGGSFTWYGADDDGRRLEAGLYFVRFTSGRGTIEKRLVVLP